MCFLMMENSKCDFDSIKVEIVYRGFSITRKVRDSV